MGGEASAASIIISTSFSSAALGLPLDLFRGGADADAAAADDDAAAAVSALLAGGAAAAAAEAEAGDASSDAGSTSSFSSWCAAA